MERAEIQRFEETVRHVAAERALAEADRARLEPVVAELFKQINRSEDYNAYVEYQLNELLLSRAAMSERSLALAAQQPYFTRVDFTPSSGGGSATYYIGKYGVMDSEHMEPVVVDWRAPIANLYYSGQIGPTHYTAPDGVVDGELTRKRQFDIRAGRLLGYYDADIVSQDRLLSQVLGSVSQGKLKEVVSTIQAEQNAVIRHPMARSLIVQGVAGSGKTTIALHRTAYLLYTYQKSLPPRCLMILAPNPLFLDYISQVLPELGVADVHQLTFPGLCLRLAGYDAKKLRPAPDDRLARALASKSEAEAIEEACRRKGSVEYLAAADRFLDRAEEALCPDEPIRFGPVTVYSCEELRRLLLEDMRPLPINARLRSLARNAKGRIAAACEQVKGLIAQDCERRADLLRLKLPDGAARRERMQRLYASRDARLEEADAEAKRFAAEFAKRWKLPDAAKLYVEFSGIDPKRGWDEDDLAALVWMQRRVDGLKDRMSLKHILVDEAQDMTPAQLTLLREVFASPTFTLVGDMGQNIHFYKGISGWSGLAGVLGEHDERALVTSYRTTRPVMEAANRVAARHGWPGQTLARPVLREGPAPRMIPAQSEQARLSEVRALLDEYAAAGYNSVCVIERSPAAAAATARALGIGLLDTGSEAYSSGVWAASIDSVKGLEFDAVVVADASEGQYPDAPEFARLMYVAMTRPLHRLDMVSMGNPSALFG